MTSYLVSEDLSFKKNSSFYTLVFARIDICN